MDKEEKREIVVPGETIATGADFLPGEGTRRDGEDIVSGRYGLVDISGRLVKVIALSGVYIPRRGNSVIGHVIDINSGGWVLDIGGFNDGFLPVMEVPEYIGKDEFRDYLNFGDSIIAKIYEIKRGRNVELSVKMRGFGKLEGGMLIKVNAQKVPRIIGKEGSMVSVIREATGCEIVVGQNGIVWIKGNTTENELKTKKIIEFICKNSFVKGLTEIVKEYIGELK